MLSNTSREAAAMVGERLRCAAQAEDYPAEGRSMELTVSLGCSTLLPGEVAESLLRRARQRAVCRQARGRNRLPMAGWVRIKFQAAIAGTPSCRV